MTKYVKTDYVPEEVDYLTAGKVYEVVEEQYDQTLGIIKNDKERFSHILYSGCAHLDNRPWTVWEG